MGGGSPYDFLMTRCLCLPFFPLHSIDIFAKGTISSAVELLSGMVIHSCTFLFGGMSLKVLMTLDWRQIHMTCDLTSSFI
ncbi:hypothetical protein BDV26DRAFT_229897 [Aspergillus bertholletiae]|uniref:Uncharacterized protein n=1 Tax=Aspergillus bertholletiae TaxID=1226010 RepID=A0A5N7B3W4_9EURO|nr:hypothetical protein BDV26DRAFT_229897 [Aspergillus bertholletiae]